MKWASAISYLESPDAAIAESVDSVRSQLDGQLPDLGVVFCTPSHRDAAETLIADLATTFPTASWIGCTGGGVIGDGRETLGGHALSLAVANLPGVKVLPFHLAPEENPQPGDSPESWRRRLGLDDNPNPKLVVLPDPFTCDGPQLISGLDAMLPDSVTVGGLASGGEKPGENLLFLGSLVLREGTVGVGLTGNVAMETIVAQGCRPIANPMFITATADPFITEIDGRQPLEVLEEIFESLSEPDRELFRFSLFLGLVMQPDQVEYGHGDFLIRTLAGVEPTSGAIAVSAPVEKGQVVQFHLRDAVASAQDLQAHLDAYTALGKQPPSGGLLFSCLGRGEFLYGEPDHDSTALRRRLGPVPMAGFFCNGEIGPVRGSTYLHGYTSIFALFRPSD